MEKRRAVRVDLKRAAELMLDGHPVIFPTETFFALGSRALDADATARVYRAKHRATVKPLPLILGEWDQLDLVAKTPKEVLPLLKYFWPGPLSIILPARLRVPDILTGATGRVAVRLSSHPVARDLALAVGEPITSSSANISGHPAAATVDQLDPDLCASVYGILDEPPAPAGGLPSTLVEYEPAMGFRILREGAISRETILAAGFSLVQG